jgi:hypothetical protein
LPHLKPEGVNRPGINTCGGDLDFFRWKRKGRQRTGEVGSVVREEMKTKSGLVVNGVSSDVGPEMAYSVIQW